MRPRHPLLPLALCALLAACGESTTAAPPSARTATPAGTTFPYPTYAQWAHIYHKVTGQKLNYQSIGSGGGIAQIKAKTVHFGASDAPLKAAALWDEVADSNNGCVSPAPSPWSPSCC